MKQQDILKTAKKHAICRDLPSVDFFEGALLGNGGLGVVVCTRPDAVILYLGHNNIWDSRICENHEDIIGTFDDIWGRIQATPGDIHNDPWYQQYEQDVTNSYRCCLPPRPYPASAIYLHFDRKEYQVLGHSLDISDGLLTITLLNSLHEKCFIKIFVAQDSDRIFVRTTDDEGNDVPVFYRMHIIPHNPEEGLPAYTVSDNGFTQMLPCNNYAGMPRPGLDKGFSVLYKFNAQADDPGLLTAFSGVTQLTFQVTEGDFDEVTKVKTVTDVDYDRNFRESSANFADYWNRSGVSLDDEFLEHIWYTNTYFIKCCLNPLCHCPGLFGNWMYGDIGTIWHGDYHMNYNTQQLFWGLMAANRPEQNVPYLTMVEHITPLAKEWARDFYHMDGACYPHSAYPTPMNINPYPSPDWGWEIFETPWTVQGLWWHYTYTKDTELLKERIYPLMRDAAIFMVEYMTRDGANPVGDDRYHLFPTIVPELYGLTEGFSKNLDGTADLTLTKFLFTAVLQAVQDLHIEEEETELTNAIRKILAKFPDYATAQSRFGKVLLSTPTEDPDSAIYNVPANIMPVFPGEDIDVQNASPEELETARRSWKHHYNEGGDDLVFYYLIGARLGILDLEEFKRHIRYCLLPDGTATDLFTLTGGRYAEEAHFKQIGSVGIWLENFSLYAVIDECLLWGHRDTIRLFPNWDKQREASFCSLRTKNAFLVDASCAGGSVKQATITSEAGGEMRLENPWNIAVDGDGHVYRDRIISVMMKPGETVTFRDAL